MHVCVFTHIYIYIWVCVYVYMYIFFVNGHRLLLNRAYRARLASERDQLRLPNCEISCE